MNQQQIVKTHTDRNGIVRYTSQELNGKKHGITQIFRVDGTLKEKYEYVKGKKTVMELFDEKEQLEYFCKYDSNSKKSHVKRFNSNRELTTDMKYKDGYQNEGFEHVGSIKVVLTKSNDKTHVFRSFQGIFLQTILEYDTDSKDTYNVDFTDITIKYTDIIDNRKIIKHMKNGKLHGQYQHHKDGNLVDDGNYVEDMRQGMHLLIEGEYANENYYVNDKMYLMIVKKNDVIVGRYEMNGDIPYGLQQEFYDNGIIKMRWIVTSEGEEINNQNFDENGNLV